MRPSFASALAIEGNGRILVAGKILGRPGHTRELLLRLTPRGGPDRSFGRSGMVSVRLPQARGMYSGQARQLLLQRQRILVLRDSRETQLVVYTRDGRHRQALEVAAGAEPGNTSARPAFGAVDDGRLLLGWNVFDSIAISFKLQRLRVEGSP